MSSEIEELIISKDDTIYKVIEYIKILISKSGKIKLIANRKCSIISAKASESLVELGYVKYDNIQTKTDIEDGRRNIKLIITLEKTNKFSNMLKEIINNENNNIIIGEIEINNFPSKKIIYVGGIDEKMDEYCDIYINNIKIEFTTYYKFPKKGTYSIKYKFNKLLSTTRSMFYECNSIKTLDLSNFNTEKVTDMCFMFRGCTSLININLSNFNTQNVTDMYQMFTHCDSIKSLDLSNFNTEKVTGMGNMFSDCHSLVNLDLSNFNTQNVTDMRCMFNGCKSLTNLDLSNFNTQNADDMHSMFSGCKSLINLDLSNFNTQNVTCMNDMFNGCNSLIYLNFSNINTGKLLYRYNMFEGCNSLINKSIF